MSSLAKSAGELRDIFQRVAKELDDHHNNVNQARVVGSSISVAGSCLAIFAGLAAPFTAGTSIVALGTLGCAVATGGGLTSTGASLVGYLIKKDTLDIMDRKWRLFKRQFEDEMRGKSYVLKDTPDKRVDLQDIMVRAEVYAAKEFQATVKAAKAAKAGKSTKDASAISKLSSAGKAPIVLVNVVSLGFSVYDIIEASTQLQHENHSPAGDLLRQLAEELDAIANGTWCN